MSAEQLRLLQNRTAVLRQVFRAPDDAMKKHVIDVLAFMKLGDIVVTGQEISMFPDAKCARCAKKFEEAPVSQVKNDVFGGGWVHSTCVIR